MRFLEQREEELRRELGYRDTSVATDGHRDTSDAMQQQGKEHRRGVDPWRQGLAEMGGGDRGGREMPVLREGRDVHDAPGVAGVDVVEEEEEEEEGDECWSARVVLDYNVGLSGMRGHDSSTLNARDELKMKLLEVCVLGWWLCAQECV